MMCESEMLQVTADMWHLFEKEFRGLWSAAVKQRKGGELALDVLFGSKAPAGIETLEVWLLCAWWPFEGAWP